jgi:hypothetical protein
MFFRIFAVDRKKKVHDLARGSSGCEDAVVYRANPGRRTLHDRDERFSNCGQRHFPRQHPLAAGGDHFGGSRFCCIT